MYCCYCWQINTLGAAGDQRRSRCVTNPSARSCGARSLGHGPPPASWSPLELLELPSGTSAGKSTNSCSGFPGFPLVILRVSSHPGAKIHQGVVVMSSWGSHRPGRVGQGLSRAKVPSPRVAVEPWRGHSALGLGVVTCGDCWGS